MLAVLFFCRGDFLSVLNKVESFLKDIFLLLQRTSCQVKLLKQCFATVVPRHTCVCRRHLPSVIPIFFYSLKMRNTTIKKTRGFAVIYNFLGGMFYFLHFRYASTFSWCNDACHQLNKVENHCSRGKRTSDEKFSSQICFIIV